MRRRFGAGLVGGSSFVAAFWAASFSASGQTPPPRSVDIISRTEIRTRGPIEEIGASRRLVAADVGWSNIECEHVVAWKAGSRSVFRFSPFDDYDCGDPIYIGTLWVTGTVVSWREAVQGNYCHVFAARADVARAPVRRVDPDEEEFEGDCDRHIPRALAPLRQTKRGIEISVGATTIRARRLSDGRTTTIRAPARIVEAEFEHDGLFYVYNVKGRYRGRITFLPFDRLRARLATG